MRDFGEGLVIHCGVIFLRYVTRHDVQVVSVIRIAVSYKKISKFSISSVSCLPILLTVLV